MTTTVVGWDGTAAADAALEWALARPDETTLHLVRVVDVTVSAVEALAPGSWPEAARIDLVGEAERVRKAHPHMKVTSELVSGDPTEELVRFSKSQTLVVVGTDRQQTGGIKYEWSVGARLAAIAHGPVAIVPMGWDLKRSGIVVGVDGSAASAAALEFAAVEAGRTGQPLHAIRAWQEPPIWMDAQVPSLEYLLSLEEMYGQILDDSLASLAERHPQVHVHRELVRGPAQKVLLEAADGAALIVVGNHGLRGFMRFLLGSVSRSIVVNALCPVVVVRGE